ncbi:MAG: FAD-dependent oxidoreductase [Mitsuaria chitosanitabida]|uniref:flavin monoamine oxidase family protein n=1 Tax=Roseateles chitosanitabidus TaxID=65048 RepID=UPI001B05A8FE|nr:FAD-dependent oxidoreductase [Roseateles chitosanitabidus]MBO9685519.1 FAD-dependent oxidoreductase [Roseateles chitosanitabidus]
MGQAALKRRDLLALSLLPLLSACGRDARPVADRLAARVAELPGGWTGAAWERGHRLRGALPVWAAAKDTPKRAQVLVLGAGIAGLACARRLRLSGVDVTLLDLEDRPGGNSRGHRIGAGPELGEGLRCPLGAHYLPTPNPEAVEVQALLEDLGLARHEAGRWVYEERWLCHSPQERLWWHDQWVDGLLPPAESPEVLAQYRRFGERVEQARHEVGFSMPTPRHAWTPAHQALDARTFASWLDEHGLDAAPLRWYLDYCCRDDYGADASQVSAWAGLHYFGSRHGFMSGEEREAVLTWPQGNGWLSERLAAPLAEAFHGGHTALRVREERHGVSVLVWNDREQIAERWEADQVVLAMPLFIASRLVEQPPAALTDAASGMRYAPWLVANLLLDTDPLERLGAPLSWDNVVYGGESLGYVNANQQSLDPSRGPMVLTAYRALRESQRKDLLQDDWRAWAARVLADMAPLHPDLPERLQRVELMRYGHAMSIPHPGLRGSPALTALREQAQGRLHVAHADLAGYSVFEEAFTQGEMVAARLLKAARSSAGPRTR